MAAFATLSLKKASCPNMSLKKAFAILALLAIIGFAQPAEGMGEPVLVEGALLEWKVLLCVAEKAQRMV